MNAILPAQFHTAPVTERPFVRIVVVGHVDHGKSTLIGRLLHETGSLPDGKLETLQAVSARRGMSFEWSFVLDALQAERDQNITIDTSQVRFRTSSRDFVLIDAPGHEQFLRNMITGAAQADAAILVIDATEGLREQTRRHGYLLSLLGVRQVIVAVNKMDRIGYDPARFETIKADILGYLGSLNVAPLHVIPLSARDGTGIASPVPAPGLDGPPLIAVLDRLTPARRLADSALRLPVQAIYRFDDRRIVAGRIESGTLKVGDDVTILPSGQTARVRSLERWPSDGTEAAHEVEAGSSVGLTLDRELFIERGAVICHPATASATTRQIAARIFWLHRKPLSVGSQLQVHIGTGQVAGEIVSIERTFDPAALDALSGDSIGPNQIGEVTILLSAPATADTHSALPATGRVVFEADGRIAGGGIITALHDQPALSSRVAAAPATAEPELQDTARRLEAALSPLTPAERLARLRSDVSGQITFTTSFGIEDQMLLHLIAQQELDIDVVTLDTGRMFDETYDLWAQAELRYNRKVRVVYPLQAPLEALVRDRGINGFYDAVENRVACCQVRKVEPLRRALNGAAAWVTGLRGDQSTHRRNTRLVEIDTDLAVLKINPLIDWSRDAIVAFTDDNSVPVNRLHAKGYLSIGCAPCTRAVSPGESERAGRWWWEQQSQKECGLHKRV